MNRQCLCVCSAAVLFVSAAVFGNSLAAQADIRETKPGELSEQQKINLESFDFVWKTIREKHWDPKLGGVDWEGIREEFRPKVAKATSKTKVRNLLSQMLDRLKLSHYAIIPNEVYTKVAPANGKGSNTGRGRGTPGFDVRVIDGKALVVSIEEKQPAAKLGVRPGWEIVKINGAAVAPMLKSIGKTFKNDPSLQRELVVALTRKLRGRVGKKIKILFRDGKEQEVQLAVPLIRPQGKPTQIGHLPTFYVHYESKKLDNNVAYFRLNMFADPVRVMSGLEKTVLDNLKAPGFIIDLRGNPGGIGGMAMGFGNWFIKERGKKLGTMITRTGTLNFLLFPRAQTYDGPLAILVDGMSGSTSEILAGGLKDLKRATIFGTQTMGAALPSVILKLPNDDGFQFAIANYISSGGKPLEGNGVEPDQVVKLTRPALLQGRDPVVDAAVAWIQQQSKPKP